MLGTVKWFNGTKGFGFIESDGEEYFVHFKSIKGSGYKMLKEGQKVQFAALKTPKGMSAVDVVPENGHEDATD